MSIKRLNENIYILDPFNHDKNLIWKEVIFFLNDKIKTHNIYWTEIWENPEFSIDQLNDKTIEKIKNTEMDYEYYVKNSSGAENWMNNEVLKSSINASTKLREIDKKTQKTIIIIRLFSQDKNSTNEANKEIIS